MKKKTEVLVGYAADEMGRNCAPPRLLPTCSNLFARAAHLFYHALWRPRLRYLPFPSSGHLERPDNTVLLPRFSSVLSTTAILQTSIGAFLQQRTRGELRVYTVTEQRLRDFFMPSYFAISVHRLYVPRLIPGLGQRDRDGLGGLDVQGWILANLTPLPWQVWLGLAALLVLLNLGALLLSAARASSRLRFVVLILLSLIAANLALLSKFYKSSLASRQVRASSHSPPFARFPTLGLS